VSTNIEKVVLDSIEINSQKNVQQANAMTRAAEDSKRASVGSQSKPSRFSSGTAATIYLSVSGFVGGILAFLLNEMYVATVGAQASDFNQGVVTLFSIALGIGLTVVVAEAITTRSGEKIRLAIRIAFPLSAYMGITFGLLSQLVYVHLMTGIHRQANILILSGTSKDVAMSWEANHGHLARAASWVILGIAVGLTVGVISKSLKRTGLSIAGGMLGGFLGGLITDFFPQNLQWISQIFGFTLMGLLVGLAMGLLEQVARMQWIEIVKGGREGKQYILYKAQVTLGSSAKADIILTRDESILPVHARIFSRYSRMYFECVDESKPASIDGAETPFTLISDGTEIKIGETVLRFRERKAGAGVVAGISN
jgi:hypothetical protein